MIAAKAGIAAPPKGHSRVDDVPAPIVNDNAARARFAQHSVAHIAFGAKEIQRQRMRLVRDIGDCLVQIVITNHWQDRPKNFFLSNPHVRSNALNDVERNAVAVLPWCTGNDGCAASRYKGLNVGAFG